MLLQEPGRTAYDWNFNFFGFRCRVHPGFLLISVLFGRGAVQSASSIGLNAGVALLVVVVTFFLAIFIHELGHALAYRKFGRAADIVLYWMGGLAISRGGRNLHSNERIFVSIAGPALGMLFGAALCGVVYALGGHVEYIGPSFSGENKDPFPALVPRFSREFIMAYPAVYNFLWTSLYINLFWNLINLLPVYPLDGGQVARELFLKNDLKGNGQETSLKLSCVTGGFVALLGLLSSDFFIAMLFGYLAYMSYKELQGNYGNESWR